MSTDFTEILLTISLFFVPTVILHFLKHSNLVQWNSDIMDALYSGHLM